MNAPHPIRGFVFGARLADTLHDELRDTADGETNVVRLMDVIVKALDGIGRAGRRWPHCSKVQIPAYVLGQELT